MHAHCIDLISGGCFTSEEGVRGSARHARHAMYWLWAHTCLALEKVIIISKVVALGLRLGAQECLQVCNSKGGVQSSPVSATHGSH